MKAVILAAGEGKRLRPFTETMPKVMLPVSNKPIIEYVVDAVKDSGIEDIFIVVGYKKEVIMKHFKDYEEAKISFIIQDNQLGTGHALLQAKDYLDDVFIVLAGDNIIDQKSVTKIVNDDYEHAVLIKKHSQPSKYGVVHIEKDNVQEIIEKPTGNEESYISTGVYKLNTSVFDYLEKLAYKGDYTLSSVIQLLVDDGVKIHTLLAEKWMDIIYPWDLISVNEAASREIPASISGIIDKNVVVKGPVSVGEGSHIYAGSHIVGPVVIGKNCEIGPNTCVFPATSIGNNTVIHSFSEIRNSVIMNDVHIGTGSFVENSIIGRGNVIKNNFSSISEDADVKIEDNLKRLDNIGIMLGDNCTIYSHVIVNPGVIIGCRCKISPLKHINKNIKSESNVM